MSRLENLPTVLKTLRELPEQIGKRVGRAAMKKAATAGMPIVRAEAFKHARAEARRGKYADTKHMFAYTDMKVGVGKKGSPWCHVSNNAPQAHLVEYGHRMVIGGTMERISGKRKGYTDRSRGKVDRTGLGRHVATVPPHPFMVPAAKQAEGVMIATFCREMEKGTARAANRYAKETGAVKT